MLTTIRKMSLRTRLALLAGFAIVALVVALFVAWRLARTTETFVLRQATSSVQTAASELARELQSSPKGYSDIEQALPTRPKPPRKNGGRAPETRVPPHVQAIFASLSDPLARLTAVTLHRFPNVEGGFYREADGAVVGYASPKERRATGVDNVPTDLVGLVREVAKQTIESGAPTSRTSQVGSDHIILFAYPTQDENTPVAFAISRLAYVTGVSDWPNVIALAALALSIIVVSGLALMTVKDLRVGVANIEEGLGALSTDLDRQLISPDTTELARIATAINELAATLRTNIARQAELERDLRQSERLSALGRVVAGVAHEVRNPLTAIKLKVQLARRSSYSSDKLDETFNVITAEIDRLDQLVRRLLELGRQQQLQLQAIDLHELIGIRIELFEELAMRSGVEIATTGTAESIVVKVDRNRLGQVFDNIMQNAIEAMPAGGKLTITLVTFENDKGAAWARVSFDDNGPGIPEAEQEHIFEPFQSGRADGTGLGLAIARAIVEEHDGTLRFVNRSGRGASFVIELPLLQTVNGHRQATIEGI